MKLSRFNGVPCRFWNAHNVSDGSAIDSSIY